MSQFLKLLLLVQPLNYTYNKTNYRFYKYLATFAINRIEHMLKLCTAANCLQIAGAVAVTHGLFCQLTWIDLNS